MDNLNTLLFAEAIPKSQVDLDTQSEFEKIQQNSEYNAIFCTSTTVSKLKSFLDEMPSILHISAHGNEFGDIIFKGDGPKEDGPKEQEVSKLNLACFLKSYTNHLNLVVLNACNSASIAKHIANITGLTTIGFDGVIKDEMAIKWSENFYSEKENFIESFVKAKRSWALTETKAMPVFYFKNNFTWNEKNWKLLLEDMHKKKDLAKLIERFCPELGTDKDDFSTVLYNFLYAEDKLFDVRDWIGMDIFFKQKYNGFDEQLIRVINSNPDTDVLVEPINSTTIKESFGGFFRRLWLTLTGKYKKRDKYKRAFEQLNIFDQSEIAMLVQTFANFIPLTFSKINSKSQSGESFDEVLVPELKDEVSDKKFYLLLGDSGTGKSMQMRLLFAQLAIDKGAFSVLFRSCTDDLTPIFNLDAKQKEKTILFLDSFDEAIEAFQDSEYFFRQIETYTQQYAKVIIACREQFFMGAIRKKTSILNVSNRSQYKVFDYKHIYLNYLDEKRIKLRIEQEYSDDETKRERALAIFKQTKNLMVRPIMLQYLEDILDAAILQNAYSLNSYQIYRFIVDAWIEREERAMGINNLKKHLEKVMRVFAQRAYVKYVDLLMSGTHLFRASEIKSILDDAGIGVKKLIVADRSLLKRVMVKKGGEPSYSFTHRTFKEFFMAGLLFDGDIDENLLDKNAFSDAWLFYKEMCAVRYRENMPDKDKINFRNIGRLDSSMDINCFAAQMVTVNQPPKASLFEYYKHVLQLDDQNTRSWLMGLVANRSDETDMLDLNIDPNSYPDMDLVNLPFLQYKEEKYAFWHRSFIDFLYLYPLFIESGREKFKEKLNAFDFDKIRFKALFAREMDVLQHVKLKPEVKIMTDRQDVSSKWAGISSSGINYLEFANDHILMDTTDLNSLFADLRKASFIFVKNVNVANDFLGFDAVQYSEYGRLLCKPDDKEKRMPVYLECRDEWEVISSEMVTIEGGGFIMGNNENDAEEHPVTVRSFKMAKKAVTVQEFAAFVKEKNYRTTSEREGWAIGAKWIGNTLEYVQQVGCSWQFDEFGRSFGLERDLYPVIFVSWYDAIAYCNFLSEKKGLKPAYDSDGNFINKNGKITDVLQDINGYRLPTEAEWEFAAGGGSLHQKWAGTNDEADLSEYANIFDGSLDRKDIKMDKVGQRQKNELDLYDMSGNVNEWCQDRYHGNYKNAPKNGSAWESGDGSPRVFRGGSWCYNAQYCRVAYRNSYFADSRYDNIGFRLATSL